MEYNPEKAAHCVACLGPGLDLWPYLKSGISQECLKGLAEKNLLVALFMKLWGYGPARAHGHTAWQVMRKWSQCLGENLRCKEKVNLTAPCSELWTLVCSSFFVQRGLSLVERNMGSYHMSLEIPWIPILWPEITKPNRIDNVLTGIQGHEKNRCLFFKTSLIIKQCPLQ